MTDKPAKPEPTKGQTAFGCAMLLGLSLMLGYCVFGGGKTSTPDPAQVAKPLQIAVPDSTACRAGTASIGRWSMR